MKRMYSIDVSSVREMTQYDEEFIPLKKITNTILNDGVKQDDICWVNSETEEIIDERRIEKLKKNDFKMIDGGLLKESYIQIKYYDSYKNRIKKIRLFASENHNSSDTFDELVKQMSTEGVLLITNERSEK
jgi:hypothetical protein